MPRTKVEFQGHEGVRLAGLLEYPAGRARAYALFAHCFSCGKDSAAASRIARALVARGIAVLRFDFTGLGNSDGDFANTNFSSNVDDLVCAADFLREDYRAPALLIGHSLGGTAVLAAAGRIEAARAVVTIGAPADPAHVIHHFADRREQIALDGEAEVDLGGRPFVIRQQFIDDAEQVTISDQVRQLRRALLVLHSPLDGVVGINEAEEIYVTAKHPKSFVSLDDADHLLMKKEDAEYAATTIAGWASRYIDIDDQPPGAHDTGLPSGEIVVDEHNHEFARVVRADQHFWFADEPTRVGGQELGPDPYEHLLAALGTCTSMTMRMYANRKGLKVDDISVRLRHERTHIDDCEECDEASRQIEVLEKEISIKGDINEAERQRLLEIADRCPVHRTLTGQMRINKTLRE